MCCRKTFIYSVNLFHESIVKWNKLRAINFLLSSLLLSFYFRSCWFALKTCWVGQMSVTLPWNYFLKFFQNEMSFSLTYIPTTGNSNFFLTNLRLKKAIETNTNFFPYWALSLLVLLASTHYKQLFFLSKCQVICIISRFRWHHRIRKKSSFFDSSEALSHLALLVN